MTIRTFWTIFLKILGIWLVLGSLTIIPQFFSTLFFTDSNDTTQSFVLIAALLLFTMGVYLLTLRLFVFKTAWLIDKLHLDKGFDEDKIDLNVQLSTILHVSTIVIGGLLFVEGLPLLCKQVFVFFQQKAMFRESMSSASIIFHLVKTVLGYLLMTNSKLVVAFIEKQVEK